MYTVINRNLSNGSRKWFKKSYDAQRHFDQTYKHYPDKAKDMIIVYSYTSQQETETMAITPVDTSPETVPNPFQPNTPEYDMFIRLKEFRRIEKTHLSELAAAKAKLVSIKVSIKKYRDAVMFATGRRSPI